LAQTLRRFHPDWSFTVLVVDQKGAGHRVEPGLELIGPEDINLPPQEPQRMAMLYDRTEFSTALKPWLLRYLKAGDTDPVIYLDPDIEIFAPLDEVALLAHRYSIILTPHLTSPMPQDGLELREDTILAAGIYNLGFIALGSESGPFLEWWSGKLKRQCVIDTTRMRFVDQRWIDFVPGLYRHYILRDEGYNVAYWNLYERRVEWKGTSYEVNGKPLRFFHFSGYDPLRPHLLSRHQGNTPRILLSQHPAVAKLCSEYVDTLRAAGFDEVSRVPYRIDWLSNGFRLDSFIRRAYRTALDAFEAGRGSEPPNPFGPEGESRFFAWLNEPLVARPPLVTRYMLAIHEALPELQRTFSEPLGKHASSFSDWCSTSATAHGAQPQLLPAGTSSGNLVSISQTNSDRTITVAGYLNAELGVGEAARLVIAGLEQAGVPVRTTIVRTTESRQNHPYTQAQPDDGSSDINIMCVNADATPAFVRSQPHSFSRDRSQVGVWFWEIEEFPESMHPAFAFVDEVWVSSEYTRQAVLRVSPKPVYKFPLPATVPNDGALISRSELLPPGFVFLFCFDFFSVFARKNPLGVIAAFEHAFAPEEGAVLVIKSINGNQKVLELEKMHHAAKGRPDIIIREGYISSIEKQAMTRLCDCYVSLHRSEGFGLTIAEAMAMGKPVIATNYSGNLEYMSRENSFLCSYEYCEIGEGSEPYPATARWAQPNIEEAGHLMRWIYENRDEARQRGLRAASDMRTFHSPLHCGNAMRTRLDTIRQERHMAA
jgi:hypothetical protein